MRKKLTIGIALVLALGACTLVAQGTGISVGRIASGHVRDGGWSYEVIRIIDGPNICYTTVTERGMGAAIACMKR